MTQHGYIDQILESVVSLGWKEETSSYLRRIVILAMAQAKTILYASERTITTSSTTSTFTQVQILLLLRTAGSHQNSTLRNSLTEMRRTPLSWPKKDGIRSVKTSLTSMLNLCRKGC
jgi:hypothetical protein